MKIKILLIILFLLTFTTNLICGLTDGLVAYLPFNGNANDESGNGNNAINYGATLIPDRFGNPDKAYRFYGAHMEVPNSASICPQNYLTISIWLKQDDYQDFDSPSAISKRYIEFSIWNSYNITGYARNSTEKAISYQQSNSTQQYGIGTVIKTNQWTHIVAIYDGSSIKLYNNGILKDSLPFTGSIAYNNNPLLIAKTSPFYPGGYWRGSIDEIRIYNRAITESEIQELYHDGEVTIGTQTWMKRNLDVAYYRNGDPIPQVTDPTQWANLTTGAWCYYNNDPALGAIYGKLYNWYAVHDPRGLSPAGWHVPLDNEWKTLEMYLGMSQAQADIIGWRGTNEGGKLKETGTSHWSSPNLGATNETGFTALGSGCRNEVSTFYTFGDLGYWWTSSENGTSYAWSRYLASGNEKILRTYHLKNAGFPVRCVKDSPLNNGLVAYYPFNGNANDESGNGNHGTNYGATITSDRFGNTNKAYYFDGNAEITVPHSTYFNIETWSISVWYQTTASDLHPYRITSKSGYFPQSNYLAILFDPASVYGSAWNGSTEIQTRDNQATNDGDWHHVVYIRDNSSHKYYLYVDNILKETDDDIFGNLSNTSILYIGSIYGPANQKWVGEIDDIRIYNRALTESEIQLLYNEEGVQTSVSLLTPNGGEPWQANLFYDITWEQTNVSQVNLYYRESNTSSWKEIANNIDASLGTYKWELPNINTTTASVKICDAGNESIQDISDNVFKIEKKAYIKLKIVTKGNSNPKQVELFVPNNPKLSNINSNISDGFAVFDYEKIKDFFDEDEHPLLDFYNHNIKELYLLDENDNYVGKLYFHYPEKDYLANRGKEAIIILHDEIVNYLFHPLEQINFKWVFPHKFHGDKEFINTLYQTSMLIPPMNENHEYLISNSRADKKPVLFVHGINGKDHYWGDDWSDKQKGIVDPNTDNLNNDFNSVIDYRYTSYPARFQFSSFENENNFNKYDVWEYYYPPDQSWIESGYLLGQDNKLITEKYNSQKVSVVAHSMGGLVARAYIEGKSEYYLGLNEPPNIGVFNNDIDKVLFLATPHNGSFGATRAYYDINFGSFFADFFTDIDPYSPAIRELSVGSNSYLKLNYISTFNYNGVIYYQVSGGTKFGLFKDPKVVDINLHINCEPPIHESENHEDGAVSLSSSSLLSFGIPLSIKSSFSHTHLNSPDNRCSDLSKSEKEIVPMAISDYFKNGTLTSTRDKFNVNLNNTPVQASKDNVQLDIGLPIVGFWNRNKSEYWIPPEPNSNRVRFIANSYNTSDNVLKLIKQNFSNSNFYNNKGCYLYYSNNIFSGDFKRGNPYLFYGYEKYNQDYNEGKNIFNVKANSQGVGWQFKPNELSMDVDLHITFTNWGWGEFEGEDFENQALLVGKIRDTKLNCKWTTSTYSDLIITEDEAALLNCNTVDEYNKQKKQTVNKGSKDVVLEDKGLVFDFDCNTDYSVFYLRYQDSLLPNLSVIAPNKDTLNIMVSDTTKFLSHVDTESKFMYMVVDNQPGQWKVLINGKNYLPDSTYELFLPVYNSTVLNLASETDTSNKVILQAFLSDSAKKLLPSEINSIYYDEDNIEQSLTFKDDGIVPDSIDGDGIYSTFFETTTKLRDTIYVSYTAHDEECDFTRNESIVITNYNIALVEQSKSQMVCHGENVILFVNVDGLSVEYGLPIEFRWQKDGVDIPNSNSSELVFDNINYDNSGIYKCIITNSPYNDTIVSSDILVYVNSEASFLSEPKSKYVKIGSTVSFDFDAHVNPIAYNNPNAIKWYKGSEMLKDSGRIWGTSTNYLTIKNVQHEDIRNDYHVELYDPCKIANDTNSNYLVSNSFGIYTSDMILEQPQNQNICDNSSATFTISLPQPQSGQTYYYQWFRNKAKLNIESNIIGANDSILIISNSTISDTGKYYVEVTVQPEDIIIQSDVAYLQFITPPSIIDFESDSSLFLKDTRMNIECNVSGTEPFIYRWFKDGTLLTNQTQKSLNIDSAKINDEGNYYCIVENDCGIDTSKIIHVIIAYPAIITVQPVANVAFREGNEFRLSVEAIGTKPLNYQWYKDSEYLPGFTDSLLFKPNIFIEDEGSYNCVVTNLYGSDTSETSEVSVITSTTDGMVYNFKLSDNFPNPFDNSTIIKFEIPQADRVVLTIKDVLGITIVELVNKQLDAGQHEFTFKPADNGLGSGVYYYSLSTSKYLETKKMVIVK